MNNLTGNSLETFIPLESRKRGVRHFATTHATAHDTTLLEGLGRAFYWQKLLDSGGMQSGSEIARAENLHHSVVNELLRLTLLAPEVVERLVGSPEFLLEQVMRRTWSDDWGEQVRILLDIT